jgi:hypothetical protein
VLVGFGVKSVAALLANANVIRQFFEMSVCNVANRKILQFTGGRASRILLIVHLIVFL